MEGFKRRERERERERSMWELRERQRREESEVEVSKVTYTNENEKNIPLLLLLSFTGRMEQTRWTGEGECWREAEVSNIILLCYTVICCIDYCLLLSFAGWRERTRR